jgi:NADP-dependent 3-hydroxy acid dehydrogenase YdfG
VTEADATVPARPPRAVIVTGASSPVARATAARLARRGDLVLMGSRRPDICERLAACLRSQGATAFAAYLDLADASSIDWFVDSARYLLGEVDVLVTDAGLSAAETHMVGAQHLAAQVIPLMIEHGRGDVVLVSPDILTGATPAGTAAWRRALDAWVSVLDAEFVGTRLRASTVRSARPGPVAPDDVACVVAAVVGSGEAMHLRLVEIISHHPAPAPSEQRKVR